MPMRTLRRVQQRTAAFQRGPLLVGGLGLGVAAAAALRHRRRATNSVNLTPKRYTSISRFHCPDCFETWSNIRCSENTVETLLSFCVASSAGVSGCWRSSTFSITLIVYGCCRCLHPLTVQAVSGAAAEVCENLLGYPFSTLRVKCQAHNLSTWAVLRQLQRQGDHPSIDYDTIMVYRSRKLYMQQ